MTRKSDPRHKLKAAMRAIANVIVDSSDEEILDHIRERGEDPKKLAQRAADIFEDVFRPFEHKPADRSVERTETSSHGLVPAPRSFDLVWLSIVQVLAALDITRVRLYLLSDDNESLLAVAHWGMAEDFLLQRRFVRDEPHWDLLASDCRLHVFHREPGKLAPFEHGISEEMAVGEWFCQILTWNGKIVGKLSGDCKGSERKLVADELRAIELLAPLLGSAIGHARLLTNLASVLRVSASALTCGSPTDIMQAVCRAAREISGVDHCSLLTFDTADSSSAHIQAEYPIWGASGSAVPLHDVPLIKHLKEAQVPLVIPDVANEGRLGRFRDVLTNLKVRSLIVAPIVASGQMWGALILEARRESYKFSDADTALAAIYASQIAVTMESQRRRVESEILVQLDRAVEDLLIVNEFDRLAQLIVDKAKKLFKARFAVFQDCRKDRCSPSDITIFASGITPMEWRKIEQDRKSGNQIASTVRKRKWVEISNVPDLYRTLPSLRSRPDVKCFQGIALKTRKRVEGLLFLGYSHPTVLSSEQRQHARKFAAFAALCLQRMHTISEMNYSGLSPANDRLEAHVSAFYEANKIITSASHGVTPAQTLDHILRQAVECTTRRDGLGNVTGAIWTFDNTSNTLKLVSAYPRAVRPIGYTYSILSEFGKIGITGRAVLDKVQRVGDVRKNKDYILLIPSTLSELAVPILEGNTVVGVLNLECDRQDAFDQLDEDTVVALAEFAAIALHNSKERIMAPAL